MEELRLEFEDAMIGALSFLGRAVSASLAKRLHALMAQLDAMATREQAHLLSERALRRAPEWADVRQLAAEALMEFDAWPRNWGKGRRRAIRSSADAARKLRPS